MTNDEIKAAHALIQHANIADPRSMDLADALRHALAHIEQTSQHVLLALTLEEITVIACAVGHHRDRGLARVLCGVVLRKIEKACK